MCANPFSVNLKILQEFVDVIRTLGKHITRHFPTPDYPIIFFERKEVRTLCPTSWRHNSHESAVLGPTSRHFATGG